MKLHEADTVSLIGQWPTDSELRVIVSAGRTGGLSELPENHSAVIEALTRLLERETTDVVATTTERSIHLTYRLKEAPALSGRADLGRRLSRRIRGFGVANVRPMGFAGSVNHTGSSA